MASDIPNAATMVEALARIDDLEKALKRDKPKRDSSGYLYKMVGLFLAVEQNEAFDMQGDGDYVAELAIDMPTARKLLAPLRGLIVARLAELGVDVSSTAPVVSESPISGNPLQPEENQPPVTVSAKAVTGNDTSKDDAT